MTSRNPRSEVDRDELPDHVLRWAEAISRRVRDELETRLGNRYTFPGGSGARLLQLIPDEGERITDLADRARVTKQSLGQLVNNLEADGLVESDADPSDARVRIVRRTCAGDQLVRYLDAQIADIERGFADEVGVRRYATMKAVLRELGTGRL
jgi:DNA-binding MarR family transcriptional regulator